MSSRLSPIHSYQAPGIHLCGMAWDGQHLWHSDGDTHSLYQLDIETGEILSILPCSHVRTGLSYDGHCLWQIAGHPKRICVLTLNTGELIRETPLNSPGEYTCGLLVEGNTYWLGPESDAEIEAYSLTTHQRVHTYGPVASADGIALVGKVLWYTSYKQGCLVALDRGTGKEIKRYQLTGKPTDMCWDGRQFWYNDFSNKQICAVQPDLL